MAQSISTAANFKNITATTTITAGGQPLKLSGIFVSSASSTPTIKVENGSTTVVNTFTPAGATFYQIPAECGTSIVVTIGGTVDCCVFWTA